MAETEGWGWPGNSRKAHYFVDAMSLCRRWMFTGEQQSDNGKTSPDDCVACVRKLAARRAEREGGGQR